MKYGIDEGIGYYPAKKMATEEMYMQSRLTRRIPVEEKTWAELSRLREPGETFDDLLNRLMEHEAGIRLSRDLRKLEQDEAFHDFSWEIRPCSGSKFTRKRRNF